MNYWTCNTFKYFFIYWEHLWARQIAIVSDFSLGFSSSSTNEGAKVFRNLIKDVSTGTSVGDRYIRNRPLHLSYSVKVHVRSCPAQRDHLSASPTSSTFLSALSNTESAAGISGETLHSPVSSLNSLKSPLPAGLIRKPFLLFLLHTMIRYVVTNL